MFSVALSKETTVVLHYRGYVNSLPLFAGVIEGIV